MNSTNGLSEKFGTWALFTAVVGLGVLFYKIVEPILIPLFLAAMLAILCRPLFDWVVRWLGGRRRAAAAMTALTLIVVLFPFGSALFLGGRELAALGDEAMEWDLKQTPLVKHGMVYVRSRVSPEDWKQFQESVRSGVRSITSDIFARTQAVLSNVVQFLLGLVIMGFALFYFFSDGPDIVRTLRSVSPFDDEDEEVVFERFASICRGVVLGTVLCALVQAVLLGIGLAIAGVQSMWLLSGLTFLFSMVPFLGAGAVWFPTAIWLAAMGDYGAAVFIGAYGAGIVSTVDNLVRVYVLHESSNMHPLVAFISVIGAIQLIGMWGVFLGPLIAALFYTLLRLLNLRLLDDDDEKLTEDRANGSQEAPG